MRLRCYPVSTILTTFLFCYLSSVAMGVADPSTLSTSSNDFYIVNVVDQDAPALNSIGSWQVRTGPMHDAGPDLDINFQHDVGGINVGTSFSGIRINSDNAYTMDTSGEGAAASLSNLDAHWIAEGPSPGYAGNGWRTQWEILSESVLVTQDVLVVGASSSTAAIYHTVRIDNYGDQKDVEWLNLVDLCLENDCGPVNSIVRSDGSTVVPTATKEFEHVPALPDELVKVNDSGNSAGYEAYWTLSHDPGLAPMLDGQPLQVTSPDKYQSVQWATSFFPSNFGIGPSVFDYAVDVNKTITGDGGTINDSAGIAYFSASMGRETSVRFTQALYVQKVPEPTGYCMAILLALGCLSQRRRIR